MKANKMWKSNNRKQINRWYICARGKKAKKEKKSLKKVLTKRVGSDIIQKLSARAGSTDP